MLLNDMNLHFVIFLHELALFHPMKLFKELKTVSCLELYCNVRPIRAVYNTSFLHAPLLLQCPAGGGNAHNNHDQRKFLISYR